MKIILLLKPSLSKVIITLFIFLFIEAFFFICSPLEYESFGIGDAMGRHTSYTCGFISEGIYKLFGTSWMNPSPVSYWYIYLPISYLLSVISSRLIKK